MHVKVSAGLPKSPEAVSVSGTGPEAQVSRLLAQLKQVQQQMKDLTSDSKMDPKAKEKLYRALQSQAQVLMNQIAELQRAAAQRSERNTVQRSDAAASERRLSRDSVSADGSTPRVRHNVYLDVYV